MSRANFLTVTVLLTVAHAATLQAQDRALADDPLAVPAFVFDPPPLPQPPPPPKPPPAPPGSLHQESVAPEIPCNPVDLACDQ